MATHAAPTWRVIDNAVYPPAMRQLLLAGARRAGVTPHRLERGRALAKMSDPRFQKIRARRSQGPNTNPALNVAMVISA